ncbi:MAG: immunoglobulin domain-containing protein [Verrucomicrobiota bacterium]|nr:immunoglobulin domain-containing protein [Verrucomicrobiota bacterium]
MSLDNFEADAAGDYKLTVRHEDRLVGEAVISITVPAARIVMPPVGGSVDVGGSHTFEVVAEGKEPITYKWYHKGALIEEAIGSTLQLTTLTGEDAGDYHVEVSNETLPWGGTETSAKANLMVLIPLAITHLTESKLEGEENWQWALQGGTIDLSVTADGTPPLNYQWTKDGEPIAGATGPGITLAGLEEEDVGLYTVKVSNATEQLESAPFKVVVLTATTAQPAKIVQQPKAVTATLGETAELSVSVEGSDPISYQWYYEGEPIEDGTERVLSIPDVQKADAGEYHVVVSNDGYPWGATETSDPAALTIESPPVITKLTESITVLRGDTIELSVTATGDEPISYQWNKGGTEVEGATGPKLILADASQSDTGDYTVTVSNAAGEVVSDAVSVTMPEPVRIVTQPQDVHAVVGESATMMVVVEGSAPIEYFWLFDGEWVEGGTESTLRLTNLQAADFGAYNVLVRNATGIEVSKPAMLTVMSPPEITQLSQSLTLIEGESVELTVTADGDEPLAYQWSWGGEAIEGATASRLSLDEVTASDAGDYSVTIGNAAGQAESGIVTVKVVAPIRIVTQPEGAAAIVGDTVTLQVVAEGTEPIRYYWYHDGELVDGATESTLRLAKSQETDSGSYNVIVQNQGGTAISEIAELIVLMPPEITQLTESLTVIDGESVELTVAALGSEPLAYQWSRAGEAIDGATAPTLRLAKAASGDAGDYSVTVSNAAGQAESGVVTVKVIEPVRIVTQPEGATAILGESVTLQVVANGTAPITYAWYHDGELVEGATESILRLAKVQAADTGGYHLVASNPGGTAKSKIAGLVVVLPPEITQLTESLSVMERDSAELSVTAVGSEPLAYQWSRDGVEIEGATAPTLPLVRVAPAAAGDYTVVARNAAGQAESNAITVEVIEPIRIVTQPEGANATLEDTVTLRVVAEGTEPINYFWLHNGRPVEGGRQSTLTLTELEAEDAGEYVVMVSNVGGQATTETAHLSVELPEGAYLVEDFDGLKLGPWSSGDDTVGDGTDWTATPPAGWTAERGAGHEPAAAVEFDGWTFLDPVSWHKTAGTEREQFTKGSGVIAVADSAHTGGESDAKFSATMATPAIDISGAQADSLVLTYDSSWREMQRKRVVAAFEEDFEGDDVGGGVTIDGSASQGLMYQRTGGAWPWLKLNGVLKLTDAVYSQNGGMLIDDFSNGAAFNEFEISFRMFMGRGTRRPADGLSVSIGNDLPTLAKPAEEGVPEAAFRVCFDAWDSGGGEAPAIEIFNGKKSVAIQKFHGQTGAADSEKFVNEEGEFVMMWHKTEWTDVKIRVADGRATVHFRGHEVIRDVPIDLSPIEAAQFLFAARTGGAHQKHYIDDIKIRLFDLSRSRVTVAYDGGEPVTLLELDTQTPSAYDETVSLPLNNPDGVQSAVITWDYHGLDNWWAVDNITVATDAEPEPTLAGLATNSGRYVIDEPITVQFNGGPGNPRDWIGIYRTYMTPGEYGSLAWMYVNGETTPGDGLPDGSVTFINNLSAGDYVVRYFKNDGYHEIADAAAFTVVPLPAVATGKTQYAPGESITVRFSDGPGDPADWISLMPLGETSSIAWAYVGSSRIPGETLATGTVTFADGLPAGEYWVMFLTNDGYRQLAKAKVTVEGEIVPPPLGFANNGDGTITLTFEGRLQTAPTINGPWQDMDATSPVTLPTDQRQRFTRSVK